MHHGHIDLMWLRAQAGLTKSGLPASSQFGGVTWDNQQCTANTKLPGYNNYMGQVMDLGRLCVRYSLRGGGLARRQVNVTEAPVNITQVMGAIADIFPKTSVTSSAVSASQTYAPIKECPAPLPDSWINVL
jgi:hypothetical protein